MKEVCGIARVTPHILKSWEKKFPQLRPSQNKSGKRLYKPDDIQLILKVRDLIAHGTQDLEIVRILEGEAPSPPAESAKAKNEAQSKKDTALFHEIKGELLELLGLLKE